MNDLDNIQYKINKNNIKLFESQERTNDIVFKMIKKQYVINLGLVLGLVFAIAMVYIIALMALMLFLKFGSGLHG